MKILIHLDSDTPLLCHEALSLAFALAAFEHEIVLYIGRAMFEQLIHDPHGKLANMVAAFELYDIPKAWLSPIDWQDFEIWQANKAPLSALPNWVNQLRLAPTTLPIFDTTFYL